MPDFIQLQPGEQAWLSFAPSCEEPGVYDILIGVRYLSGEAIQTIWADSEVTITKPAACYDWEIGSVLYGLQSSLVDYRIWDAASRQWTVDDTVTVHDWIMK